MVEMLHYHLVVMFPDNLDFFGLIVFEATFPDKLSRPTAPVHILLAQIAYALQAEVKGLFLCCSCYMAK